MYHHGCRQPLWRRCLGRSRCAARCATPAGGRNRTQLAGRSFQFEVYGEDKPLIGTSTWDLERGVVYGTYLLNNSHEGKWKWAWFVDGDRNCTKPFLRDAECRRIYRDGEKSFQVGENGTVYAVLTPLD